MFTRSLVSVQCGCPLCLVFRYAFLTNLPMLFGCAIYQIIWFNNNSNNSNNNNNNNNNNNTYNILVISLLAPYWLVWNNFWAFILFISRRRVDRNYSSVCCYHCCCYTVDLSVLIFVSVFFFFIPFFPFLANSTSEILISVQVRQNYNLACFW